MTRERALFVGAIASVCVGALALISVAAALWRDARSAGPAARPPAPTVTADPCAGGRCLPELEGRALDGQEVVSKDLRGQVLLLTFWAPWCEPCREEIPVLEAAFRRHRAAGFRIVAVLVDPAGSKAEARRILAAGGATYPSLVLTPSLEAKSDVTVLPAAFLYDRDGRLVRRWTGGVPGGELDAELGKLLSELAPGDRSGS